MLINFGVFLLWGGDDGVVAAKMVKMHLIDESDVVFNGVGNQSWLSRFKWYFCMNFSDLKETKIVFIRRLS